MTVAVALIAGFAIFALAFVVARRVIEALERQPPRPTREAADPEDPQETPQPPGD